MFGDEGAANHNRLGGDYGEPGLQLFIYGREEGGHAAPVRYPARQTLAASQAVARLNQVNPFSGDFCPAKSAGDRPGRVS